MITKIQNQSKLVEAKRIKHQQKIKRRKKATYLVFLVVMLLCIASNILLGMNQRTKSQQEEEPYPSGSRLSFLCSSLEGITPSSSLGIICLEGKHDEANATKISKREVSVPGSRTTAEEASKQRQKNVSSEVHRANDDVAIAYITYSHLGDGDRWRSVILPATQLMVPPEDQYYVVMTTKCKDLFESLMRKPEGGGNIDINSTKPGSWSHYEGRIHPIWVDCPEAKFGESPCCKMEKGLLQFFNQGLHKRYDWILYQDDDMYIRHNALQMFLGGLPVHERPLILASDAPSGHLLGQAGYLPLPSYSCDYKYQWGQPVVYNRAAFDIVSEQVFTRGGLVTQCMEYNVTHDVGNALIHWMLGFPTVWMRITHGLGLYRDDMLGAHRVGRRAPINNALAGKDRDKMFVEPSIHTWHRIFKQKRYRYSIFAARAYVWRNFTSKEFERTSVFREYGPIASWTDGWHTMPPSDCLDTRDLGE